MIAVLGVPGDGWKNVSTLIVQAPSRRHRNSHVGDILQSNPLIAGMLATGVVGESDLRYAFLATILQLMGLIAAIFGAQVIMRLPAAHLAGFSCS